MPKVIKLLERVDGKETEHTGRYLVYFNPDAHAADGTYHGGTLITTAHIQTAARFSDATDALEYWKRPVMCACHRLRSDGKPNRPLTAYTVTIEDAPAGAVSNVKTVL